MPQVADFLGNVIGQIREAERRAIEGITVRFGNASFRSPTTLLVDNESITSRAFLIATGSRPAVPALPGITEVGYLTNETAFDLTALPASLVVIGGGPVGCELGQAFARLGTAVTLIQRAERLLPREDPDVSRVNRLLLEQLTGYPVRSEYKHPAEPDVLPRADAMVVFPATFNTINKWALGISDTLALGLLCEYTGLHLPIVAVPCVRTNSGLDTHPAFPHSLERLRSYGVEVLYEPETYPPKNEVPPPVILQRLEQLLAARRSSPASGPATDQANGAL